MEHRFPAQSIILLLASPSLQLIPSLMLLPARYLFFQCGKQVGCDRHPSFSPHPPLYGHYFRTSLETLKFIQLGCHLSFSLFDWWASIICAISVFTTKLWYFTLSHLEWLYVLTLCFPDCKLPFKGEIHQHLVTEPQNVRGWQGPLRVTQSNPPAEAGSPTAGCTGPHSGKGSRGHLAAWGVL